MHISIYLSFFKIRGVVSPTPIYNGTCTVSAHHDLLLLLVQEQYNVKASIIINRSEYVCKTLETKGPPWITRLICTTLLKDPKQLQSRWLQ